MDSVVPTEIHETLEVHQGQDDKKNMKPVYLVLVACLLLLLGFVFYKKVLSNMQFGGSEKSPSDDMSNVDQAYGVEAPDLPIFNNFPFKDGSGIKSFSTVANSDGYYNAKVQGRLLEVSDSEMVIEYPHKVENISVSFDPETPPSEMIPYSDGFPENVHVKEFLKNYVDEFVEVTVLVDSYGGVIASKVGWVSSEAPDVVVSLESTKSKELR